MPLFVGFWESMMSWEVGENGKVNLPTLGPAKYPKMEGLRPYSEPSKACSQWPKYTRLHILKVQPSINNIKLETKYLAHRPPRNIPD